MSDYIVTDTELTSVANAIRAKGETSAQLAFPGGFVSAVQAIPTGITPTGTKQITLTENGTFTEDVTNYASAEITVDVQGGGHTQFTFDNTITTAGGRDNAHAIAVGLLPYQQIEIVGYAYLVGATTVQNARLNCGLTTEQLTPHFYINTDGDTTTQFRITGEFVNGAMKYVYSYPGSIDYTKTIEIMYNEFSFHWITLPSADTPVVIHATVTANY